jgi:hypothetical protein
MWIDHDLHNVSMAYHGVIEMTEKRNTLAFTEVRCWVCGKSLGFALAPLNVDVFCCICVKEEET